MWAIINIFKKYCFKKISELKYVFMEILPLLIEPYTNLDCKYFFIQAFSTGRHFKICPFDQLIAKQLQTPKMFYVFF